MKVYPLIYFYFVEFCKLSMNQKRGLKFRNVDFGNTWIFLEHFWMNKKILCEAIYIVCAPYYVWYFVLSITVWFILRGKNMNIYVIFSFFEFDTRYLKQWITVKCTIYYQNQLWFFFYKKSLLLYLRSIFFL